MDWFNPRRVLALPVAQHWAKPFSARVASASGRRIQHEAIRATIEALTRKLRYRKWIRRHTSISRVDGRSDSRYYRSPRNPQFVIRISNHAYPGGSYPGAKDYIINMQMMETGTVLDLIAIIEADERAYDYEKHNRHRKRL